MHQIKFDSILELGEHVNNLVTNKVKRRYGTTSTDTDDPSFYGKFTMADAIECAQAGGNWAEGARKMPKIAMPATTLAGAPLPVSAMSTDMAGFAPCVPNYLSGLPDDMYCMADTDTKKMLRVAVHVGRSSSVEPSQALNRGAAIMAVLDNLSREGYAIELHAIWRNTANSTTSIETVIKHGCDVWTPEAVAFALCHVAFQRRLCWRVAESMADGGDEITDFSYGTGTGADFSDFDLSYGYVLDGEEYDTLSDATAIIRAKTLEQLNP